VRSPGNTQPPKGECVNPSRIASGGIYPELSIDDYHAEPTVGTSISSSGLRTILLDCPAKYWAHSHLNPNRVVKETAAMNFGRAAHALVLGEPAFASLFVVSPFDDFRGKEARAWRDEQQKTIVKAEQLETIKAMADAIKRTPQTANAFGEGRAEVSILWEETATGVWLKARPDWLPADHTTHFAQEFKTAVSIEPRRLSAQAFALGYDMQAALVYDGLVAVTGERPLGVAHVVQEKEPPYLCDLRMFSPEQIDVGRARYMHALRIFVECLERMREGSPPHVAWPGYTDNPVYFTTPKWVTDSLMEFNDEPSAAYRTNGFGEVLAAG
jgi:hypothetical protein